MVDPSKFKDKSDSEKSKKSKKKKSSSKRKKKSGNSSKKSRGRKSKKDTGDSGKDDRPDTYNAYKEGENFELGPSDVSEAAKSIPGADGEDARKASDASIDVYINTQEREMREMYSSLLGDIRSLDKKLSGTGELDDLEAFTISLQAAIYNMAQQRAGVAEILVERFDKSTSEAVAIADRIAKDSGEGQSMDDIISYIAEGLVD